jgi:hypothetical protein
VRWRLTTVKKLFVLLVLCVLLLPCLSVQCRAASETDAQSAVNEASQRIVTCYEAVVNASNAGANVSALLQVLNTAGNLFSRAQLALASGDFNSSYTLALQSQQTLDGFDAQATSQQNDAAHAGYTAFMVNVVGSVAATVAVLSGSFAFWTWLKKRPVKRTR